VVAQLMTSQVVHSSIELVIYDTIINNVIKEH
jgi:hypothetical protein